MFPNREARDEAMEVFQRVRGGVEGYLWVQTVTGGMICVAAWILMRLVGLQNAEFWTFVIFIVGFIPVLGGAIAGLAPPLFALVQFPTYWPALILLVGLQADPVRRRQRDPAAHAGRQPEHRPGRRAAGPGPVGQDVGRGRHVPVDAAGGHGHGHPGRVQGLDVDGHPAVGRRRPYADEDEDAPAHKAAGPNAPARVKPPRAGHREP